MTQQPPEPTPEDIERGIDELEFSAQPGVTTYDVPDEYMSIDELRRELYKRGWRPEGRIADEGLPSFTCPKCGMTSYNPADIKQGYCGLCHAYTGKGYSS